MMNEYEIRRLARALAEEIVGNENLLSNLAKHMPQADKLLSTQQVASMIGTSRYTVIRMAERLGGIKNENGRWFFRQSRIENYINAQ